MKKILALLLVLTLVLAACGGTTTNTGTDNTDTTDTTAAEAKTIQTEVEGHNGPVKVSTTFDSTGTITAVVVDEHAETEGIADPALDEVPAAIVENNSIAVDTVGGATVTSDAVIKAVEAAITEAGYNVDDYR